MSDIRAKRDLALVTLEREAAADIRAEAADTLCELAFDAPPELRPEFEPVVVRMLADKQNEVRCAGLALASEIIAPAEAKDILIRHLTDKVARVRVEAAGRLADLALPESRGALAAALQDPALTVRFEAARGMVALKHPAGLEVLLEALDDTDLRFRAASALAQLGNKDAIAPLKRAFSSWFIPAFDKTQLAGALASLGDADGSAHLFKRSAGRKWAMDRPMAVELLGAVKAPGALPRLLEISRDPEDPARGTAARALGRLGDPAAEPALAELLASTASDDLKLDAAEGLLLLGTPAARARVAALRLADPDSAAELAALLADFAQGE